MIVYYLRIEQLSSGKSKVIVIDIVSVFRLIMTRLHFEISGDPYNLIGCQQYDLFPNHTIFCSKLHLFPSQWKINTKQQNQTDFKSFHFKVTNQIAGKRDIIEW